MNRDTKTFAQWLNDVMQKNNIKQTDLAKELSTEEHTVNRSTINLWLSNSRLPNDMMQERLAKYFSSLGVFGYHPMIREIIYRVHVTKINKKK
ncbi:helix-turn-helix transcriptional regulator [Altibacter sp.]|uniref:helix-turn-helix domain-containing protein n=1 Tax=Altibacter sp. TaxID=2024823 RepID=UPI0025B9964E|nr:helix-turn-helix transcriptional regulator [Altibacter sp.]